MYKSLEKRRECMALSYRKRYHKNRNECIIILGEKCVKCGFKDKRALNIDHINGGGTKECKKFGGGNSYYKKILDLLKNGSNDYQLLCSNCNQIKRYEQNEINRKY